MERSEKQQGQSPEYEKLSSPERTVFEILQRGKYSGRDIPEIARKGNMSEMHVKVAMQLLYLRRMTDINPETE